MNRYRVTLTAMLADSRDYEVTAASEQDAWTEAEDHMQLDMPNLSEIRRDSIELIGTAPLLPGNEPEPDALTQARALIDRLLDAADHGATDLLILSEQRRAKGEDVRRAEDAIQAIEDARKFLAWKPPAAG